MVKGIWVTYTSEATKKFNIEEVKKNRLTGVLSNNIFPLVQALRFNTLQ